MRARFSIHCALALLVLSVLVVDSLPGVSSATLQGHSVARPAAAALPVHSKAAGGSEDLSTGPATNLSHQDETGPQFNLSVPANGAMCSMKELVAAIGIAQETQIADENAGVKPWSAKKPGTSSNSSSRAGSNASTAGASGLKMFAAGFKPPGASATANKLRSCALVRWKPKADAGAPNGAITASLWGFFIGRPNPAASDCDTGVVGLWLYNTGSIVRLVANLVLPHALYNQLDLMVRGIAYTVLPEAFCKELTGTGSWATRARSSFTTGAWVVIKVSAVIWGMFVQCTMRHAFGSLLSTSRAVSGLALAPVWGLVDVLQLLSRGTKAVLGTFWGACGPPVFMVCRAVFVGASSALIGRRASAKHEHLVNTELVHAEVIGPEGVTLHEETQAAPKRHDPRAAARRELVRDTL